jgi:hypothetical protein
MSRIDALPADQRSVLQLLLKQGKGYDDLSGLLHLDTSEVRSRAYDALNALGPGPIGLPAERRQAITDWLLGQQSPDEASATRAFVDGSPAGRAWAGAVAEQLRPLAADRLPELPLDGAAAAADATAKQADAAPSPPAGAAAGAASADAAPPAEAVDPTPSPPDGVAAGAASADAEPPAPAADTPFAPAPTAPRVSRRGGAILIAAVLAAVVAVVLVLVLTGGDDNKPERAAATTTTATQPKVKAQVNLTPPKGAPAAKALAIVQIVESNGQNVVNAVAQGLPTTSKAAYGIWAYTSPSETRLIGGFDKTDNKGHLVYQGALPQDVTDVTRYKEILVTRETSGNPTKPGTIYLRGPMQAGSTG